VHRLKVMSMACTVSTRSSILKFLYLPTRLALLVVLGIDFDVLDEI